MTKFKPARNKVEPVQTADSSESEVSDLLKTIEEMGRKAGCMLNASNDSLTDDEILLLEDVQTLGVRAEYIMVQKAAAEGFNPDEFVISKSLSRTDVGYHLTLTSVEEKLNELHALWGKHGQVLKVNDLTDDTEMEFTFVIWSHHKGRRAVLTGAWKTFCRKHGLKVGDEISISASEQSSDEYVLSCGKNKDPLAVLKKKVRLTEGGEQDADGTVGNAPTLSTTISGETLSLDNMQNVGAFGETGNPASLECDSEKTSKITEDEKIMDLADYLFKLSSAELKLCAIALESQILELKCLEPAWFVLLPTWIWGRKGKMQFLFGLCCLL
ncbi:hypothetical protein GOP47_0024520 [Adiantum capillus-veneris]|uniref:TF-B3 domain-containing protein n=1 Tax=Adiantum capillus-veneris TaxID=13818 RepID=A0A9D4Z3Q7_ADICA|nr:hypothetical protein GOP47_0024520 [Adiantum capillus-veneris]